MIQENTSLLTLVLYGDYRNINDNVAAVSKAIQSNDTLTKCGFFGVATNSSLLHEINATLEANKLKAAEAAT